ncbi:hypothetical protein PPTG_23514 [Phytophthora nicotianae INRA-310]|uniref:Uncharacterized protein n=1 Tax=Phytophthora nicotianae (strain INRA-310) TaxID=761204 RepID=W2PXT8_PHYN3|nr:hypothetical protein PPTG_23514 [Phytophthora nicotianae INRA-310]ETN05456.1 hypothetical protein PPTG_23514 [Phytophthora nicotianae INRA-310]
MWLRCWLARLTAKEAAELDSFRVDVEVRTSSDEISTTTKEGHPQAAQERRLASPGVFYATNGAACFQ